MFRYAAILMTALLLAGCHAVGPPAVLPGHGGVPSGQAKKLHHEHNDDLWPRHHHARW